MLHEEPQHVTVNVRLGASLSLAFIPVFTHHLNTHTHTTPVILCTLTELCRHHDINSVTHNAASPDNSCTHAIHPSGCVVECWICNREVAGSNLGLGYFAPRSLLSLPSFQGSDILVLKLISVLVFILFSSQNFYFI